MSGGNLPADPCFVIRLDTGFQDEKPGVEALLEKKTHPVRAWVFFLSQDEQFC